VYFTTPAGRVEDLSLVLTKAPRPVTLEVPFQVRDVPAPK
jgi:hypothetical protein